MTKGFRLLALMGALPGLMPSSAAAQTTPGETSGESLAPLQVVNYDKPTGAMRLSYQTGCGTLDNNLYIGDLEGVSSLSFSGEVCGIGTSGTYAGFNPGPGSHFFLVVGNDGLEEGSYGLSSQGGTLAERAAYAANTCGEVQNLANACAPVAAGGLCASSADCGSRQACTLDATGVGQCVCLSPFSGGFCESCAPGYAGDDCRECAPGFYSNAMQNQEGGIDSVDITDPELFRCAPDVPGDCGSVSCGGDGTCVVAGREAVCVCDEGYTGSGCLACAPNYERGPTGACELGPICREAKCGGNGDCVAADFGDVTCACDAGFSGSDCGGPPLAIFMDTERFTLYDGESVVLEPRGGTGPYSWQLLEGPAILDPCDGRPGCPLGAAELTIDAPATGLDDLELVKVGLFESSSGLDSTMNLAALPSSLLPFTGGVQSELLPFYRAMLKYMRARGIRAGVLGISKGGSIIATNGYGYLDAGLDADPFVNTGPGEAGPLVQPDSPFRIASVTKPLTAAAVRQAAEDAVVDITSDAAPDRAAEWVQQSLGFDLVAGPAPVNYNLWDFPSTDPRWALVTIEHLLNHHVGYWRDSALASTEGLPAYDSKKLPFTVDNDDESGFQHARTGTSQGIGFAHLYAVAALQADLDPRPTVENVIRFASGNQFDYWPGGFTGDGDTYSNVGYMMAGRALEGLKGQTYDPDEPGVPSGWGKFPDLLQDYLCEASGVYDGIYPGDTLNPYPGEPYYRAVDGGGSEKLSWNLAEGGDKIRFDALSQQWQFCQADCDGLSPVWGDGANAPTAYGGIWLAHCNSAGGMVATTSALLRFARNHKVKFGSPNETGEGATGTLLPGPAAHGEGSSHNGVLPGRRSWLWQMGGDRINRIPTDTGAWNPDPSAPLTAFYGETVINETLQPQAECDMPDDVAVAVMFNQSLDRRAPGNSNPGNSTNKKVYGRIIDFLGDAACQVDSQGWPQVAEPPALEDAPGCN